MVFGAQTAIGEAGRQTIFQVVSIMTSTGFATADYELWSPQSKIIILLLMIIGGCAGSTAGGFKVVRFRTSDDGEKQAKTKLLTQTNDGSALIISTSSKVKAAFAGRHSGLHLEKSNCKGFIKGQIQVSSPDNKTKDNELHVLSDDSVSFSIIMKNDDYHIFSAESPKQREEILSTLSSWFLQ